MSIPTVLIYAAVVAISLSIISALWEHVHQNNEPIPAYNEIPARTVKHIATKDVLRRLSGIIDVAVVGSGIGALSSAAVLSRCGYVVAVFEQHGTAGGSTHTFEEDGWEFDVGVHYVGGPFDTAWFGSPIRRMYSIISDGKLEWCRLASPYDIIYNASTGEKIEVTNNPKVNRKLLMSHFPNERQGAFEEYDSACLRARVFAGLVFLFKILPPLFLRIVWPLLGPFYRRAATKSTIDILTSCGLSSSASGALTYHWGNVGTPPGKSPFLIQSVLETHYKGGAYFPRGGSMALAKTIISAINRRGGHVFVLSPVEEILTKKCLFGGHQAIGVRVRGVDVMVRKCVVSDAGFRNTFGDHSSTDEAEEKPLVGIDAGKIQRSLIYDQKKGQVSGQDLVEPSPSDFSLFVGLDATDGDLGLSAMNVWHLKGWNHDENLNKMFQADGWADMMDEEPFIFLSSESAKDSDYAKRHPGKATVELFAPAKYEWFLKWSATQSKHRGKTYEEIKSRMVEYLLEVLYLHFPQTKGHVVFTSLGTPLTNNHYLGRKRGEVYNLDHTIARFSTLKAQRALHPQTTVKNLYLTGQDAFCVSVSGSTMSGFLTAGRISTLAQIIYTIPTAITGVIAMVFG